MTGKFQVHGVWLKLFDKKIPFPLGIFPAYLLYKQKREKMEKETLYKFFDGKASREEKEAVRIWLESSPENEQDAFQRNESFSMR